MPKDRVQRLVTLRQKLWDDLAKTAKFHDEVFQAIEAEEKVSRNDLIESFLEWALEEYWTDKGGWPMSDRDRKEKVSRHAEKLKAERSRNNEK